MEYQRIRNLLVDTASQPSKFRTRNWVEVNDELRRTYNFNSYIKFMTIRSNLSDYNDEYIHVKGTTEFLSTITTVPPVNNNNSNKK